MTSTASAIRNRFVSVNASVSRLFGFDFFISYAWSDGRLYAEALERILTARPLGYRCFLDKKEMGGGEAWRTSVRRALKRSSVAVLVATPAAIDSQNVFEEIKTFSSRQSPIVPINFMSALDQLSADHRLFRYLEERIRIDEQDVDSLRSGTPSSRVIEFLSSSFGFVQIARIRTLVLSTISVLLIALSGSLGWYFLAEREARTVAEQQRDATLRNESRLLSTLVH